MSLFLITLPRRPDQDIMNYNFFEISRHVVRYDVKWKASGN